MPNASIPTPEPVKQRKMFAAYGKAVGAHSVAFVSKVGLLSVGGKLQALVYDILPSTTAVFSYAIGSRKLSANEQFFVGAQTVVSLLQTTQIISDVCFITDHVAYASSNKTTIV